MIFSNKKLLILGANPETAGLVKKANDLGIITYVTDYDPKAFAKKFAKVPCNIDANNLNDLEALIKAEQIDGVLCGVAESLMPTYAKICQDFCFPCYGDGTLFSLFVDKSRFKDACRQYGVPVVDEFLLKDYSDASLKTVCLPVVVKPVDSCSSKGISVCRTYDELKTGIEKALSFSKSKKLIVERYMTGEEAIVYYAFQDGEPSLVAMCDRYTNKEQKGVAQLPTSYIFPSKHLDKYIQKTDESVRRMFKKLGVKNGFMFIQSFVDDNGDVKFYEPGYRLNGAQEHYIVNETTGIDAKECLIRYALSGQEADYVISKRADPKLNGRYGCKLSPLAKVGKIAQIVGLEELAKNKNIVSINPSYETGGEVTGYGTLKQIVCRFFIVAQTKEDLKDSIDYIYEKFDVLDDSGHSLLMQKFDTSILIRDYE